MPADDYDVRALALPVDQDFRSPAARRSGSPAAWPRSVSFRRNDSSLSARSASLPGRLRRQVEQLQSRVMRTYRHLTPVQRALVAVALVASLVLSILFLAYNERIFHALVPYAKKWREVTAGWLILWFLILLVSFPPLIGYSTLLTVAGFVYGFPKGWFIAASATTIGSTLSFLASRSLLKTMVSRLVANDKRFAALALTLKHDGLKLLIMIRLCPLPYSLSNGAMATFPTVHWAAFGAATAIVTPKLMLHIFIGSQLARIAESGGKMDSKTKAVSYISIFIGLVAGAATGWFMYKQTQERARQLEAEERDGVRRTSIEGLENEYADDPGALESARALREDEDDISLRSGWGDDFGDYHDDPSDDGVISGGDASPNAVFRAGDGEDEDRCDEAH